MKKKTLNGLILVMVFAVLAIGIYFGMNEFAVTSEIAPQPGTLYVAQFGYLECKALDSDRSYPSDDGISFGYKVVTCQQAGTLTQDCTVKVQLPTYQEADKLNAWLMWQVGRQGTILPDGSRANIERIKDVGFPGASAGQLITINLAANEYLVMNYIEDNLFQALFNEGNTVNGKTSYYIRYKPFYIFRYDSFISSTGGYDPNTKDCTFDNSFTRANPIIEQIIGSNTISPQVTDNINSADLLRSPNKVISYISGRVAVDPTSITLVGNDQFCKDNKIYPILEIKTTAGSYFVADEAEATIIKRVECCDDGDALSAMGAGYTCQNFEIVAKTDTTPEECTISSDCTLSQAIPGIGKEVFYEQCVSGLCELKSYTVECTNDAQCAPGYCAYDPVNPRNSECRSDKPVEYCPNTFCEASRGENEVTCPQDCAPGTDGVPQWVFYSIIGAAVLAVFAALASRKGGSGPVAL